MMSHSAQGSLGDPPRTRVADIRRHRYERALVMAWHA